MTASVPLTVTFWGLLKKASQGTNEPLHDEDVQKLAEQLAQVAREQLQQLDPQAPGKVTGYRTHDQFSIDTVNSIKETENMLGELLDSIREAAQQGLIDMDHDMAHFAVLQIQTGYMWLVRSIFQPDSKLKP